MTSTLSIILIVALLAVLIVLLTGVFIFVRGGDVNKRWSVKLMSMRVVTQAVALLVLGVLMVLRATS
jgi:hypothetical protein